MARHRTPDPEGLIDGHPCHSCGATCCRYIGLALARPRDLSDSDLIRWYLSHEGVCVYIDRDEDWWVQVDTDCRHIGPGGACAIYESRPQLCRDYGTHACERADHDDENVAEFATVEQFESFLALNYRVDGKKLRRRHRRYRAGG